MQQPDEVHSGRNDLIQTSYNTTLSSSSGVDPAFQSESQRQHLQQQYETQKPEASVMRAGAPLGGNPLQRSEYQIADESIGGTVQPFDKERLEEAKGHLVEAMKGIQLERHKRSETKSNNKDHLEDEASMDTARYNSIEAPKATAASPITLPHGHASTGLSSGSGKVDEHSALNRDSNAANTSSEHPSADHSRDHMAYSDEHGVAKGDHMPASMKGHHVSTAAVMGATSATFPAPPMNDSVISTTDLPPTAPGQAIPDEEQHVAKEEGERRHILPGFHFKTRRLSANKISETEHKDGKQAIAVGPVGSTTTEATKTAGEEHHSLAEKFKNVFRRRSSADKAKDYLAGTSSRSEQHGLSSGSSGSKDATAATSTTTAFTNPFPADSASKGDQSKDLSERQHKMDNSGDGPSDHGIDNPMVDLHAAPGVPATKVDVQPTTTFNNGHNSTMSPRTNTNESATVPPPGRRPSLAEKIVAPVVGAASYLGHKAATAKEAVKGSLQGGSSAGKEGNLAKGVAADAGQSPTTEITAGPILKDKISAPVAGTGVPLGAEGLEGHIAATERETLQDNRTNPTNNGNPVLVDTTARTALDQNGV